ncbi:MAG: polysaccharide biosynthesis tyrosine autokinase [Hyphomicrobiales bacterium]|nr:polysaccharide biosynthesis tyrosine autokinase [Hyphomicrobiales bacterium]
MLKPLDTIRANLRADETAQGGFDIHEAVNFLWRQWKFILGVTALSIVLGAVHVSRQTPMYTSSTQLLLNPRKEKAAGQDSILTEPALDLSMLESEMATIKSTALLRRVVEREHLMEDPEFGGRPGAQSSGIADTIGALLTGKSDKKTRESARPTAEFANMSPEMTGTVEAVKGAVNVSHAGASYVLNVSFTSSDPAKAARLANAVTDAYVVDKLDARLEAAQRASSWLNDRLVELRQQLRASEEAVARFRADNNLVQAGAGATLNQEQLAQMNARLVAARADTAEKRARLELLQRLEAKGGNVSSLPDVMNSPAIADLRRQEVEISRQEAELAARYNDRHPQLVNVRAQLADVRRAIGAEVKRMSGNIRNEYDLARARQEAVEKTLREVTGQTDMDASKAITLRELERTAAVNKSLFEDFLQRARVTQEQSTFEARDARVLTPALPAGAPSAPQKGRAMMVSLLIGLAGGLVGAYLLELLSAGFTTPKQLEDLLDLPLLASIPNMEPGDLSVDGAQLRLPEYLQARPLSRFSEAFRSLRSSIQMSDVDHPPKVLQITSTIPSEGKSTVGLTIASSAAQSGQRVLVIDCDLRHPMTTRFFKGEREAGLVEYLMGSVELDKAIFFDNSLRFWVLPAGGKTQNPPDLLSSDRMRGLVNGLKPKFDLIIIDTPPMGPVIDPLIVSGLVDKVIYVVRWAATAREMVLHSVQRLGGHSKIAGVIFNRVVEAKAERYGRYAYSYHYGGRYYKKYYTQ